MSYARIEILEPFMSVDPGEHCFYGWWNARRLQVCGNYWKVGFSNGDVETRVRLLGRLVIEDQVVRRNKTIVKNGRRIHVNIDPSSTITLAQYAGAVARDWGYPDPKAPVKWVKPESWKRTCSKPKTASAWATYPIHRLVMEALDPGEVVIYNNVLQALTRASERLDLADGVGLGLWELGRLGGF